MYQALIIFHVLVAAGVVALVLLQQGRGADAGAAFGSGASGTVFGAQGSASFLTRATAVLAVLFFVSSLTLAILGDTRKDSESFMDSPVPEETHPDLPPGQIDLDTPGVSDLPDIPSVDANVETDGILKTESVPNIEGKELLEPEVDLPGDLIPAEKPIESSPAE